MKNLLLSMCVVIGVMNVACGDSPRDKVCLYYNLGPSGEDPSLNIYLANYYYGDTCYDFWNIEWPASSPPFPGSCIPEADCQNCESLGSAPLRKSPATTLVPMTLLPPNSIDLSVAVDENYIRGRLRDEPGGMGLPRITMIGTPRYVFVPNPVDSSNPHYVLLLRREIRRTLPDGRYEYFDVSLGFELTPTDPAVKALAIPFNGRVRNVNLFTRSGSLPLLNCLTFDSGTTKSYVYVKDSKTGWRISP